MPPHDLPANRTAHGQQSDEPLTAASPPEPAARARLPRATLGLLVASLSIAALVSAVLPAFAVELDTLVLGTVFALSFAATAAWNDARTGLVPDPLVIAAAATSIATAIATNQLGGLAIGAAIVGLPLIVLHLVSPAAMGFGDVKLGLALGGAIGLVETRLGVVVLAVAAAGTVIVAAALRRRTLPFGPALVASAVLVTVAANPLVERLTDGPPHGSDRPTQPVARRHPQHEHD